MDISTVESHLILYQKSIHHYNELFIYSVVSVFQVESSQKMIRIVGLSATLPTYTDVAQFLRVNKKAVFYFDARFRPVPLSQTFIGIKSLKPLQQMNDMDQVCYEKVYDMVRKGHQVCFSLDKNKI